MSKDIVLVDPRETVLVEMNTVSPPAHPCAVCGRDTLEHVSTPPHDPSVRAIPDARICASTLCRHVQPL